VVELCRGGELFDKIIAKKFLTEKEAASILKVIVNAVDYLHRNGVSIPITFVFFSITSSIKSKIKS
jgi:serine/threonine protein kinase